MADIHKLVELRNRVRRVADSAPRRAAKSTRDLPGTLLSNRLKGWGIEGCMSCSRTAKRMDQLGPDGCESERDALVEEILPRARKWVRKDGLKSVFAKGAGLVGIEDWALRKGIGHQIDWAISQSRGEYPDLGKLDVVILTMPHHRREAQTGISSHLAESGIMSEEVVATELPHATQVLKKCEAKVCIIRSMMMDADGVAELSVRFPDTQFVVWCQSGPSHLVVLRGGLLERFSSILELSRSRENVWLATPDRNCPWQGLTPRGIWLPNTLSEVPPGPDRLVGPVDLSLIGRRDAIKNFPNQVIAAGLANKARPCRLHVMVKGDAPGLKELAESCGVEAFFHSWRPHAEHRKRIAAMIDIGLQASYSETFNFVAVEHLLCGKPVIGSHAMSILPEDMQVEPNDVQEIADTILSFAGQLESDCAGTRNRCREIGNGIADINRGSLVETVQRLNSFVE